MNHSSRRALITGLSGFTGHYVRQELEQAGWQVFGIDAQSGIDKNNIQPTNILDGDALDRIISYIRPNAVIHLAAQSFVGHADTDQFYQVNLLGTRQLLVSLSKQEFRPDCVLLASSANIYGNSSGGMLDETTPPNPANDYAVSKLAMEHMARLWFDKLPIVIARPFNYTGVGQTESFLLPKIVGHFARGADTIELGNLDVSRDFSDVRTVAYIYRRLLEVCPAGETVNVCSGNAYSLREIISFTEEIAKRNIKIAVNPKFIRSNEVKVLCGNPSKTRTLIGTWPSISIQDTLKWMFKTKSKEKISA